MSTIKLVLEVLLFLVVAYLVVFKLFGMRVIGNDKMGIVERWWAKKSLSDGIIALNGESGFLPDVLRGGIHFRPGFKFKVHTFPLITVPAGQIAYIFARSGEVLPNTQKLGRVIPESNYFQDVKGFLEHGGQKGPQLAILREGTYALNLAQFVVLTKDGIYYLPLNNSTEQAMLEKIQRDIARENGFEPVVIKGTENITRTVENEPVKKKTVSSSRQNQSPKNIAKASFRELTNSLSSAMMPDSFEDDGIEEKEEIQMGVVNYTRDLCGVVTVHDGLSLPNGEIIAPIIADNKENENYHNNFQDPEKFLKAGGMKGKQLQVLTEGTYYINRLFATVEFIPKTVIPVGFVGVVNSFTGSKGNDTTGESYKHGELVATGCKGVWAEPLMPGKYAFNTYAGEIKLVPTTNIILKWVSDEIGQHQLDANLKEIELITKDAFQPSLPLSVVMHIDYKRAPWVIQRFGDMDKLVNQTLDPLIASYFKNIGQVKTLIELLQERSDIQKLATNEMKDKFEYYNLELEEVLIGTPKSSENDKQMDTVLEQLRQRQVAKEQIETFESQRKAAEIKKSLKEAEAVAEQQSSLTASEINIKIEYNKGQAEAQKAEQDAKKIRTLAEAEADKIRATGKAEADKIRDVGNAEASAIQAQVEAYGGSQYQLAEKVMTKFAEAIAESKVDIVPKTIVNMGGSTGESANAFENLTKLLITNNLGVNLKEEPETDKSEQPLVS